MVKKAARLVDVLVWGGWYKVQCFPMGHFLHDEPQCRRKLHSHCSGLPPSETTSARNHRVQPLQWGKEKHIVRGTDVQAGDGPSAGNMEMNENDKPMPKVRLRWIMVDSRTHLLVLQESGRRNIKN